MILSLRNEGFSDAQLLTVAEDFSASLIPSVEGAFEQIGPMNAAEIDAALTLLKMAETTAAIEVMGTELSLIRQSGILLAELGNYGIWNPNGITALGNALDKGIQPETIAVLRDKGIYPGRYEALGIDSESKAQEVLGEGGRDVGNITEKLESILGMQTEKGVLELNHQIE